MGIISRAFRAAKTVFFTEYSKVRWKNLKVDGLFQRRRDTQIIISGGKVNIGRNVKFQKNVSLTSVGGVLSIGNNVSFNRNCILICRDNISIADDVIFGPGVTIYDHDHIFTDRGVEDRFNVGDVTIDKGCWLAANVIILRNTHIGEGCVIGAGAVVKGDIPPHSLVTSNRELCISPIMKKEKKHNLE